MSSTWLNVGAFHSITNKPLSIPIVILVIARAPRTIFRPPQPILAFNQRPQNDRHQRPRNNKFPPAAPLRRHHPLGRTHSRSSRAGRILRLLDLPTTQRRRKRNRNLAPRRSRRPPRRPRHDRHRKMPRLSRHPPSSPRPGRLARAGEFQTQRPRSRRNPRPLRRAPRPLYDRRLAPSHAARQTA